MKLLKNGILVLFLLALLSGFFFMYFNPIDEPFHEMTWDAIDYYCIRLLSCDCPRAESGFGSIIVFGEPYMSMREACYSTDECVCPIEEVYNE